MQHQNLFVFDIETIPDIKAGRNLLNLFDADEAQVREGLTNYHLQITDQKNSFLRQPFHQVVCISFLEAEIIRDFNGQETYKIIDIRSGGDLSSLEPDLVKGFFAHLKKNFSRLVSFNGKSFDLPVLKYAAMKHGIEAAWLYKSGDKWNNYQQRYSLDWHCDLAEAFSDFGASARVKMNELCAAFNLPGKIGVDGSQVTEMWDEGRLEEIRNYCETDVLNTFLLYLVYQNHNGSLSRGNFIECKNSLQNFLQEGAQRKQHFAEFLHEWKRVETL
jgi:predicted PolB exonuclease-like 3'-5' exonuclease